MQFVLSNIRRFLLPLLIGIGIVLILGAFFLGRHMVYQAHPELSGQEKATAVLAKVEKLIELPQGEAPQMATIEDAASVKTAQPFLANAQNGDVLIVYASAETALLYRPSTNKLIAVGPVDTSQPKQQVTTPAPEPQKTATTTDHATTTKPKN
jgi:hypothetical protein